MCYMYCWSLLSNWKRACKVWNEHMSFVKGMCGGCIPLPSRLGVWGIVVSSPSGVRGRAASFTDHSNYSAFCFQFSCSWNLKFCEKRLQTFCAHECHGHKNLCRMFKEVTTDNKSWTGGLESTPQELKSTGTRGSKKSLGGLNPQPPQQIGPCISSNLLHVELKRVDLDWQCGVRRQNLELAEWVDRLLVVLSWIQLFWL